MVQHVRILETISSTVSALPAILVQHVKSSIHASIINAIMELHVRPQETASFVFVLNFILEPIVRRIQTPVHKVHVKMVESAQSQALVKRINVSASRATQEPTVRLTIIVLTIRARMVEPAPLAALHTHASVCLDTRELIVKCSIRAIIIRA